MSDWHQTAARLDVTGRFVAADYGGLLLVSVALGAIVGAAAISTQTLWIDECGSAVHAIQKSLTGVWQSMLLEGNSNVQIPLYHVYLWAWSKAFGQSEFALRSANIPQLIVCLFAWSWAFAESRQMRWTALAALIVNPFVWYYVDEARPYMMLLAGASLQLAPVIKLLQSSDRTRVAMRDVWLMTAAGVIVMAATSIITLPWIVLWMLCLWMLVGKDMPLVWMRQSPVSLLVCAACLTGLGMYYGWTLLQHFRTSSGVNTPASVAFSFYEHLGFMGLGPGRNSLRENPIVLTRFPFLALLAVHGLVIATFTMLLVWRLRSQIWRDRATLATVAMLVVPVPIVFAMGIANETRILGRHIAPLALLFSAFLTWGSIQLWCSGRPISRLVSVLPFATLVLSCAMLRLSDAHQKDDYRDAVQMARAAVARGDQVLWGADTACAAYYGLPLPIRPSGTERVSAALAERTFPYQMVVLSKPDLYDPDGKLSYWLDEHRYRQTGHLEAFTFWERR